MATDQLRRVLGRMRGTELADRDLLDRFLGGDASAFEGVVRRHGPMVLGVCRRVLSNRHDAEDAFQATFLVLARKAASLSARELLGNWLYGVAYRTALKARAAARRRRAREQQVDDMPEPHAERDDTWSEVRPLLDRELHALPQKYRAAVVLCELQGVPRRDAARQLGLPEGTLSSRLAAARKLLARRLARRGVTVSAVALAGHLARETASAAVPAPLVASIVQAAALVTSAPAAAVVVISANVTALTQGVLQGMLLSKIKAVTAIVVLAGALGAAAVSFSVRATAAPQERERPAPAKQEKERPKGDRKEGGERPGDGQALRRHIEAIDAAGNKITLVAKRDGGGAEKQTYPLAKDVQILVDEKPGKLATLRAGDQVTVQLSADGKEVARISAAGRTINGDVKLVDPKARTVTLLGRPREDGTVAPDQVLKVAAEAKILVDGKTADLGAIRAGERIQVRLSLDGSFAVGITQGRGRPERDRE